MKTRAMLAVTTLALAVAGTSAHAVDLSQNRAAAKAQFQRASQIPFPADNPFTVDKADLGKTLFFDPRLSGSNWISCATCHNPTLSWGDGMAKGLGNGMGQLGRRSPTILNLAWADLLMWDGRKVSLEDQALGPIEADVEMAQNLDTLVAELKGIPDYNVKFESVFPGQGINKDTIAKAIATYERTVVSGMAPFDRWVAGDEAAISEPAKRGFDLFVGKANCASCHSGWAFTDHSFHDIGLPDDDIGRGKFLPKLTAMQHAFKTPTLRDVARRAPYMHDGSVATLEAVVKHYDTGFVQRASTGPDMKRLNLSNQDVTDLVTFMRTLTSEQAPVVLPVLPAAKN